MNEPLIVKLTGDMPASLMERRMHTNEEGSVVSVTINFLPMNIKLSARTAHPVLPRRDPGET